MLLGFISPGPVEMCIIAGIALLLFGNRLPAVMRSMGSSITQFKKGMDDVSEVGTEIENKIKE